MTDDEYRDLIERAHQIRELTSHTGWDYLVDRAHATMAAYQRTLLAGSVKSMEDYKKTAGFLEGAEFVLSLSERVDAEVQRERDERRERDES